MAFTFGKSKTYPWDLDLFKKLGLQPFEVDEHEEFKVGEYSDECGKVVIFVTCLPAQFWRFIVTCNETGKEFELSTGSGSLTEYWGSVEKIMQNMIDIKQVKQAQ